MEIRYASLCVLSFERPDFFEKSFASLVRNTTYPYELIVHDDGSKDIPAYDTDKISWFVMNHEGNNMGLGKAMRNCVGIASGDYVFKLDADLEYLPGWLETMTRLLDNNPDVGVAGLFDYRNYDPDDKRFEHVEDRADCWVVMDFVASAWGARREVVEKFGKYIGDDGWQLYVKDKDIHSGSQKLGKYRIAIPKRDVVVNFGFGAAKSVYVKDGAVHPKHDLPKLFGIHI